MKNQVDSRNIKGEVIARTYKAETLKRKPDRLAGIFGPKVDGRVGPETENPETDRQTQKSVDA